MPSGLLLCDLDEGSVTNLVLGADIRGASPKGRVQAVSLSADCITALASTTDEPGFPQLWMWRLEPEVVMVRSFGGVSEWVSRGGVCCG